jgi:hypothetical protein
MWAAVTRQRTNMPGSTLFTDGTRSSVRPSPESRGAGAMSTTYSSSSRKRRDWICQHFRGVCCIGVGIARYALFRRAAYTSMPSSRDSAPIRISFPCQLQNHVSEVRQGFDACRSTDRIRLRYATLPRRSAGIPCLLLLCAGFKSGERKPS